jgi:hypothetical protein
VSPEELRRIAAAHGLLAWLGVALTIAAAWLSLRRSPARRRRIARVAAAGSVALLSASVALGARILAPYQGRLKQRIFLQSPQIGWLFERKMHLSFGAVALAWCALFALVALEIRGRRERARSGAARPPDPEGAISIDLHRAVVRAYAASALLAAAAAAASSFVAHRYSF